ncbi:uncharacterized protein [Nicotiana tomentosiformis]|uniref:uncharacterized protein n=1 Tax=Nicotiana tomentosiformis TaxID=4098 RepID=UPI00388CCDDF
MKDFVIDEQITNIIEIDNNKIQEEEEGGEVVEKPNIYPQEKQEVLNKLDNYTLRNIYDPSQWTSIDTKLRDLLVEKGPIKITNIDFSKDKFFRHFFTTNYIQKLANGERHERRWLVYSKDLDKVFCSCCKLFNTTSSFCSSKLASDGSNDWRNISAKLKAHETSKEHIINMGAWIDLDMRLHKSKTIDKDVQEQISRDREHWKNILSRIIVVIKTLGKNNLAFRGKNEKIYQESNGIFLSLIEMIAEFDPIMQEHVRRIKHDEIHNHYLGHNIQNELINLLASEIKNKIIDKIIETKYFSIILDCTPDASHQEQISFILRSVDITVTPVRITEYFLEFLKVDDTSGKCLFEVIVDEIKSIGLDIDNLRGQGYDNGSNMKGKHQGVQKRLLDINPRSFYTPCVNSVSKHLQSKDMHIDVAIDQLRGLISFFKKYREEGLATAMISAKEIAYKLNIEPEFRNKRVIYRKKQFDENVDNEITKSLEKSFRVDYFLYIVDQTIFSLQSRFEQFEVYENIFGFLFSGKTLRSLDDENLNKNCLNLECSLKHNSNSDIDGLDLFYELKV